MVGSFAVLFVGGVFFYLLTSGTSYLYYCVWRRERFFPGWNPNTPEEHKVRHQEWRWAFYNLFGHAVVTAPIHHLIVTGRNLTYFGIGVRVLAWNAAGIVVVFAVPEPLVCWGPGLLCHPVFYTR